MCMTFFILKKKLFEDKTLIFLYDIDNLCERNVMMTWQYTVACEAFYLFGHLSIFI